jgi:putative flippase GtrA
VALVKAVYGRIEHLVHEVAKFGIVGALSYVVTILVDEGYLQIEHTEHLTAYLVASVVSTFVAYLGSRYWTYRHRDTAGDVREMVLFAAINAVAIVIQEGVVALTYYGLHMTSHVEDFLSEFVLAIGIGMVFRFWSYRTFIFPDAEPSLVSDEFQYTEPLPTSQLGRGVSAPGL